MNIAQWIRDRRTAAGLRPGGARPPCRRQPAHDLALGAGRLRAAQLVLELIALARQMRAAERRGEELGLSEEELAFYDALETNVSAGAVLGDRVLRNIAQELTRTVRKNATIDWSRRESARAKLRLLVKKTLRRQDVRLVAEFLGGI